MVLKKKSLTHILENNNEPEETPQASQHVQLQTVQPPATQPPAASRQAVAEDWGELLIKLLASAPEDVAQKLASCIDREVLLKVLEKRDDPYLKVALLLLAKK
jgi:hypothetical protein